MQVNLEKVFKMIVLVFVVFIIVVMWPQARLLSSITHDNGIVLVTVPWRHSPFKFSGICMECVSTVGLNGNKMEQSQNLYMLIKVTSSGIKAMNLKKKVSLPLKLEAKEP